MQFLSFLLYTATQQDTFLLMLYHSVYYKTRDSKEEWTPVVRKRKKCRRHVSGSSESDSDRSKVDVSCSRLVRYKVRDETPGLAVFSRGPATWTPIKAVAVKPEEAIAARTRSKSSLVGHCL